MGETAVTDLNDWVQATAARCPKKIADQILAGVPDVVEEASAYVTYHQTTYGEQVTPATANEWLAEELYMLAVRACMAVTGRTPDRNDNTWVDVAEAAALTAFKAVWPDEPAAVATAMLATLNLDRSSQLMAEAVSRG